MTHYSEKPGNCEVNIFKPSGKWAYSICVDMTEFYDELDGFKMALIKHLDNKFMEEDDLDYIFVCINPYLKHEYPRCTRSTELRHFKKDMKAF